MTIKSITALLLAFCAVSMALCTGGCVSDNPTYLGGSTYTHGHSVIVVPSQTVCVVAPRSYNGYGRQSRYYAPRIYPVRSYSPVIVLGGGRSYRNRRWH